MRRQRAARRHGHMDGRAAVAVANFREKRLGRRVKTEPAPPARSVYLPHISPVHRHTDLGSP